MFTLPDSARTWLIYGLVMAVLAVVTFSSLATHQFSTHDEDYVEDGAISQVEFSHVLTNDDPGRPTFHLYLWAVYPWFGETPAPYHVAQVVLHFLASLMVAAVVRRYGGGVDLAMVAGLFFLIAVNHFRVVHWIACTAYVLAVLFVLVTALFYHAAYTSSGTRRAVLLGAASLSALAAVLSHPSAVAIGALCFVISLEQVPGYSVKRALVRSLPVVAASMGGMAITLFAYSTAVQYSEAIHPVSPAWVFVNLLWLWGRMLSTAFWLPGYIQLAIPQVWELALGAVAIALTVIVCIRTRGVTRIWGLWGLLVTLPYLNNTLTTKPFGPFRYLYLPSIGFVVLAAWILVRGTEVIGARWNARAGQVALLASLMLLVTSAYTANRKSEAVSLFHSGRTYIADGRKEAGFAEMARALRIDHRLIGWDAYQRLIITGFSLGKPMLEELEIGIRTYPDKPEARALRGVAAFLTNDERLMAQGLEDVRAALQMSNTETLTQDMATAMNNVGIYYFNEGDFPKASRLFETCLAMVPTYTLARKNLAVCYRKMGRTDDSIRLFYELVDEKPDDFNAVLDLSRLLSKQKRYSEAIELLANTIEQHKQVVTLYTYLAEILEISGRRADAARIYAKSGDLLISGNYDRLALEAYQDAARVEDTFAYAWRGQANALSKMGREAEADAASQEASRLEQTEGSPSSPPSPALETAK